MEEIIEGMKAMANMMTDWMLEEDTLNKFAKIYMKFYDALIKEGFTEEQAMRIIENYAISMK